MIGKDILSEESLNILGKTGIQIEEGFIGKILKKQIGHYANECPNKFNKKNIELDPDIENMIQQEEFIKVNKLEDLNDLHLDKYIYETDSKT